MELKEYDEKEFRLFVLIVYEDIDKRGYFKQRKHKRLASKYKPLKEEFNKMTLRLYELKLLNRYSKKISETQVSIGYEITQLGQSY